MYKTYAIIFFVFSTLYLVTSNTFNVTDVFFDKKLDIIFHNGKLYLPKVHPLIPNDVPDKKDHENKENESSHVKGHHHEEELATGETFWIYLFIVVCKK